MTSARVRRRRQDPDVIPETPPPTAFGQRISTDTYMVAKTPEDAKKSALGGEYCVQTVRDGYSGLYSPYPLKQRHVERVRGALTPCSPRAPAEVAAC